MVAELVKYKPSCKLPFVTLGIQLQTAMHNPASIYYYRYTTSEAVKSGICLHCGNPFFKNITGVKRNIKFCSTVNYHRRVKPEWIKMLDELLDKLKNTHKKTE